MCEQGKNYGGAQKNPVTPDILMTTVKNKTNFVIEIKHGKNSDAKYQNAGYIVSIAVFYRKKTKNQVCIPMLSIVINVTKEDILKSDNSISLYGYVPSKNLEAKNMK